ncbi:MliC family protein [Musicola keenii]|uniref:MliC family protein n=1 Tax=Musicola keenii TaxID=2884250 RepID=UPI001780FD27|nr:MliC family protein [Musicola keenii]
MKPWLAVCGIVLLSGCALIAPKPQSRILYYQCGTMPLTVTQSAKQVVFLLDGESHTLPEVSAASGTRYSDNRYTFWSKGRQAFIMRGERVIVSDCTLR